MSLTLLPWVTLLGPALLLLLGLVPARLADRRPRWMRGAAVLAATVAAVCAVLSAMLMAVTGRAVPGALVHLDAVSGVMLVLVAGLGLVVTAYSRRYLDGDPGQGRFTKWLCLTLAAVLLLVQAGHLVLLALAWIGTSLALHQLLVFYPERPAAQLAARKKFLASRAGDACLLLALPAAWFSFGSLELPAIVAATDAMRAEGATPPGVHVMALLLALAALLKSAQFPVHGWLPEVMETPTPVSALLHAGIINAGGFLLVRLADVVALSAGSMDLLLLVGGLTAVFGAAVMLVQTSVKVQLAWSTLAQMGFMIMQCGLGAFAAALLHIVAHSLYKAHAFLSAGGVAAERLAAPPPPLRMGTLLLGMAAALLLVAMAGAAFQLPLLEHPGVGVLGAILLLGLVPLLAAGFEARRTPFVALRALALGAAVAVAYFGLQLGAEHLLGGALPPETAARGPITLALAVLTVLTFALLLVLNVLRRAERPLPGLGGLYVHLLNGFYVNAIANRLVARHWPIQGGRP